MPIRLLCVLAVLGLGALPAASSADPYTAPGNKVLWGGQGGYKPGAIGAFTQQSGKHPAVFNYFISWGARVELPLARLPPPGCGARALARDAVGVAGADRPFPQGARHAAAATAS